MFRILNKCFPTPPTINKEEEALGPLTFFPLVIFIMHLLTNEGSIFFFCNCLF